jgi:hypothetical protein
MFASPSTTASPPQTMAGHRVVSQERAGGLLNLRLALDGAPLVSLARALAKLDGVRVTTGPQAEGHERCYLVHCAGFKMVLSSPTAEAPDHVSALVSRSPQAALALMSDLGAQLERLMSEPSPVDEAPTAKEASPARRRSGLQQGAPLARSGLKQGAPLARKTPLLRKTPLARGRFDRT